MQKSQIHLFRPCRLVSGNDGNGEAVTAEYSWTRDVNVLAIDHVS